MIEILNSFGGERAVINIGIFICMFLLINSVIHHNIIRIITSLVSSIFVSLQLTSLYSTQSFIGYQFFVHFNFYGIKQIYHLFIVNLIVLIAFTVALFCVYFYSFMAQRCLFIFFNKHISCIKKRIFVVIFSILSFTIISINGNFINNTKTLFTVFSSNTKTFKQSLEKSKMSDYVSPKQIRSKKGKNIIVISLESFEKGFLSEQKAHLSRNLIKLKNEWNYYDLNQNVGSGWTSGSLYTCLTGFPAFFGRSTNAIFETAYDSKITSISHVLEYSGYQNVFMNGNASYSGVDYMLNAFNFNKIIDKARVKESSFESSYGIRDKDLFELAKNEVKHLSKSEKPFFIFLSTTDTHFPNGIYDKRMEDIIAPQNTNLEFMISAVDYMVGDFITYLKKLEILENTSVYIFPDHLKMGDPLIFKNTGKRGLYLITNAKKTDIKITPTEKLYQIDLPKIILNGAKIEHNQKFFTDYISGNKDDYIRENILKLTAINTSGLSRLNGKNYIIPEISKHYQTYKNDTLRYIAHAGGIIDNLTYTNSLEALNLSYAKGFRLFELDIIKTTDGKYVAAHSWQDWKRMSGYQGKVPINYETFLEYKIHNKYTPLGIDEINNWFKNHHDAILVTDKINEPKLFSNAFIASNRLMMELFTKKAVIEGVQSGILSSMPSESVFQKMDWDELIDLNIKHISVSRFFIEKNKKLLKKLKNNGIKVYVYHINIDGGLNDTGIDENYVTKYELDYIYGMYADKWSF